MKYESKSKSKTSPKEQELLYLLQEEYECEKWDEPYLLRVIRQVCLPQDMQMEPLPLNWQLEFS